MYSRVRLGQSPVEVAPLGVGCWAWGDKRYWRYEEAYGPRDVIGASEASVAAELDLFDTAEVYGWGKSEKIVGALARRSEAKSGCSASISISCIGRISKKCRSMTRCRRSPKSCMQGRRAPSA